MTGPISARFLRDARFGGEHTQPGDVAAALADFISAATETVDLAIYDFRLSEPLASVVVHALTSAAARGVAVRIGYDAGKPDAGTAADFAALQADPAPVGTAQWVRQHFTDTAVQVTAIHSAPQLMHSKYIVRDASAVWTGSTNFTDDAWTLQENNILTVESVELAAAYQHDFQEMWESGAIRGSGAGDGGSTTVGGPGLSWNFAPGDGRAIDAGLAHLVRAARSRIVIAAMVLTSHPLLAALAAAVRAGAVEVSGIYDSGQMSPIVAGWRQNPADAHVVTDWVIVSALLADKRSTPYSPTSAHDFMHNKILVCDDSVITGSYNFSANAQRNAENQVRVADSGHRRRVRRIHHHHRDGLPSRIAAELSGTSGGGDTSYRAW